MRLFTQILLLQQKDLKLLWRRKILFLLEILFALVCFPFTIMTAVKGTDKSVMINGTASKTHVKLGDHQIRLTGSIDPYTLNILQQIAFTKLNLNLTYHESIYSIYFDSIIYVHKIDLTTKQLDYRLHKYRIDATTGWVNNDPYCSWKTIGGIVESAYSFVDKYLLNTQATFEMLFLDAVQVVDITSFTGIDFQDFPRPTSRSSPFLTIFPFFFVVLFLVTVIPMILTARDVLHEKEADIKTYLMSMGMSSTSFYFSHFLSASWKITTISIVTSLPIALALEHTYFQFLFFVFIYAQTAAAFALLTGTIFKRPVVAYIFIVMVNTGLSIFTIFAPPNRMNIGLCFVYALSPLTALHIGLCDLLLYELVDKSSFSFNTFPVMFTWPFAMLMLLVDLALLILLANYLDSVLPSSDGVTQKSWLFCFQWLIQKLSKRSNVVYSSDKNGTSNVIKHANNIEPEGNMAKLEADIQITDLVKKWSTGEVAVNHISLKAYRGNVTVLLGHNGAGKSSTFACLTGFAQPTSGEVLVCGESVATNLSDCQQRIGYCPQNNPLFNNLTVYEHLVLYGRLRHGSFAANDYVEITNLLRQVGLLDQMNELVQKLSGGMKRKLFVALALVGKAQVVLLDEPTAGMDPGARQQIRNMLITEKRNRTILLTTHYMDEADLLGDRVAIMVKGEIVCNGSVDYLKQKYGTGYVLSIALKRDEQNNKDYLLANQMFSNILKTIRMHVDNASVQGELLSSQEFKVLLPFESRKRFAPMFEELEARQDQLGIATFGLSINSLEQVFIRVGELAEGENDTEGLIQVKKVAEQLCRKIDHPVFLADTFKSVIPLNIDPRNNTLDTLFNQEASKYIQKFPQLEAVPFNLGLYELNSKFYNLYFNNPPLAFGFSSSNKSALLPDRVYFSNMLNSGSMYAMNFLTNVLLRKSSGNVITGYENKKNEMTDVIDKQIDSAKHLKIFAIVYGFLATLTFGLCMTAILSLLILNLTAERFTNFKHQLFLTQIKSFTYWLAQLISDFIFFITGALLLFLMGFWSMKIPAICIASLWPLWIAYFLATAALTYCFSLMFRSAAKAFAFMFCWHTIIPIIVSTLIKAAVIFAIFQMQSDRSRSDDLEMKIQSISEIIDYTVGLVFPGILQMTSSVRLLTVCQMNHTKPSFAVYQLYDFSKDGIGLSMIIFLASFVAFISLLSIIQSRRMGAFVRQWTNNKYKKVLQPSHKEDEDVLVERNWIAKQSNKQLSLAVRQLYKFYSTKLCAVRNLTFGVRSDDCFGLLGVNGAGKTSTFDILTAVSYATSGKATIEGCDVGERPPIGYCPQFDALAGDLTGRETLTLIGALNGLIDVDWRVDRVLESVQLTKEAEKLVKFYSGGQKRRISIGVALMSCSRLIMLDEPTAGVDPRTRRHIWNLLGELRRNNTALLLTTHSMEECEVLCTRIGFMNKGSMISIGSSQHLKSKYGSSFLLSISLQSPLMEVGNRLNSAVCVTFGACPTTDAFHMSTLTWQIAKKSGLDTWSGLYKRVDAFVHNFSSAGGKECAIKDYSLVQSTLEEVFIRLSKVNPAIYQKLNDQRVQLYQESNNFEYL